MGLKVLILALWGLATIIACVGLWNAAYTSKVEGVSIGASIVVLIANFTAIALRGRSVSKEYETDK